MRRLVRCALYSSPADGAVPLVPVNGSLRCATRGDRLFFVVDLLEFGYAFFFLLPRKKIVVCYQVVICELMYALSREVLINAQYLACTPDDIDSDSIEMGT